MTGKSFIFRFADVEVHEREFSLVKAGESLAVEPKAFRVLLILLRNPQKLIPKEELLNAVWGDAAVTENSLTRAIALLRRLLGDDARTPRFIETVATVGYRFVVVKVEMTEDSAGSPGERDASAAAQVDVAATVSTSTRPATRDRRRLWMGLGAVGVGAMFAAGFWLLHRPLPAPRVAAYTQITHDGVVKRLAGTDGSRLYFSFTDNSPNPIAEVSATGGAITPIPVAIQSNRRGELEDVSNDGSNFLIASNEKGNVPNSPQWNIRVPGGSLRRLPDAVWATFSPDGNSVAYFTAEDDIWLVDSDGTGAHKLSSPQGALWPPFAWSPDGSAIRFGKNGRLWEISSSGANLREVLPGWHLSSSQCCGRWTPDGTLFVFLDAPTTTLEQGEIWALDERRGLLHPSSAGPVQLTTGPVRWAGPLPGKDGKTIFAIGATYRGELSRFDTKTGQFQSFLGGISAQGVSYSRDGRFIAYVSYPDGILWKANRDGSSPVQLIDPPVQAFLPRWSPDGTEIVFTDQSLNPAAILVVPAAGGSPQRLIPEFKEPHSDPGWSSDGKRIVFATGNPGDLKDDLRILDLATRQIATVPGSAGTFSPRWSPDGRSIAALRSDELGLKIFEVATGRWSELPQKGQVWFPEWSSDSQFIYFLRPTTGDSGVFRIRAKGGEAERVADLSSFHIGGWWNSWMGLDSANAPLLLRDVGSDDIYALTLAGK